MKWPNRMQIKQGREVDPYQLLETTLDEAINLLTELRKQSGGDAMLSFDMCESYGDAYLDLGLTWTIPESDEEYDKRIALTKRRSDSAKKAAAKRKKEAAKVERELYEKLRKKYDNP